MKKKRFYNNKKRGQKWTEEVKGRKINFADKYIDAGNGSDKFDNRRPTVKKPVFTRDNFDKLVKRLIVAVLSVCIVCVGYTVMDVHMQRNAMPDDLEAEDSFASLSDIKLRIGAASIIPLSMDGGVMLESVIDELQQRKYTAAMFDLKRSDGTISYLSKLATIETYGAVSSPAGDMEKSIRTLKENDVLPVARVCCYKDNIAPLADPSAALTKAGVLYKDEGSNTYLNPNSDTAYSYIKEIIEESVNMGISIFVLDCCDLPEEARGSHDDGFESLSKRLYNDISGGIRLIEAKQITVSAKNAKAITKELEEKLTLNQSDIIYYIAAKNEKATKEILDNMGNVNYIIAQ